MMSSKNENAHVKVYLLNKETTKEQVEKCLCEDYAYFPINIQLNCRIKADFDLFAWVRNSHETDPDWKYIIAPYLDPTTDSKIEKKKHSDLVMMAIHKNQEDVEKNQAFIIPGGMGSVHLQQYLDTQFGLMILSRIFNESENTISNLDEKSVIGDILASIRYYRHPRVLSQEDTFGKIYNRISIKVTENQIQQFFPSFFNYINSNHKQRSSLTIDGSSSLDLRSKLTLPVLLNTLKDIDILLSRNEKTKFNRTLIPLTKRKNQFIIAKLENELRNYILDGCLHDKELDLNICPIDFENFYRSLFFAFADEKKEDYKDLEQLCDLTALRMYFLAKSKSTPSVNMAAEYDSLIISTYDNEKDLPLTKGRIQAYINAEIRYESKSYFILDNTWYELHTQFDNDLSDRYKERILSQSLVSDYPVAPVWEKNVDEKAYLDIFERTNPQKIIKVHPLKTSTNIEFCDLIHVNEENIELIFAKIGVGATTRDLVSQVKIAANILSYEIRKTDKPEIEKLYNTLLQNHRVTSEISKETFLAYFSRPASHYTFILLFHDDNSEKKLKLKVPNSRIAAISLLELDSYMQQVKLSYSLVAR